MPHRTAVTQTHKLRQEHPSLCLRGRRHPPDPGSLAGSGEAVLRLLGAVLLLVQLAAAGMGMEQGTEPRR